MKRVYIGGSLFTDKQIKQRMQEERLLKDNFNNIEVYNPITNDEINDKTKKPTAKDIFIQDTTKIIESDIITADLDDIDTGLAMELGVAYGINFMFAHLIGIIKAKEKHHQYMEILNKVMEVIPFKKVYATCSDIRQDTKNENGIHKSWGQNQYIVGGIEIMGEIYRHFEDVIEALKEDGDLNS